MKCPRCGSQETGAFCSQCGTALAASRGCARCGADLTAGARFCTRCGARAGGPPGAVVPVAIAIAVIAVVAAAFWFGTRASGPSDAPAMTLTATDPATAGGNGGAPPPLTGSMREQADRLFERIMRARSSGNDSEAQFFLPMALTAYEGIEDLDADGLFHLGLLQIEGARFEDARATADRILALDGSHLFGHAVQAEGALAAGDTAAARAAYRSYVSDFDAEIARALPEYEVHRPALDEYLARGRDLIGG